jgi:hypothetical protein
MSDAEHFAQWHIALVAYSIVQAGIGYIVVNEMIPRSDAITQWQRGRSRTLYSSVVTISLVVIAVTAINIPSTTTWGISTVTSLACIAATLVAVQAALAHILDYSRVVYGAGLLGFAALCVTAALNLEPAAGLTVELAISGGTVATWLLLKNSDGPFRR